MKEFVENFYSSDFAGDLVVNDEDEEEIDFWFMILKAIKEVKK